MAVLLYSSEVWDCDRKIEAIAKVQLMVYSIGVAWKASSEICSAF